MPQGANTTNCVRI